MDHIEAVSLCYKKSREEINSLYNLTPACSDCDIIKSNFTIEQFREKIATFKEWAQYPNVVRIKKLITNNPAITFYFEIR